jgi:hypothetical protein
MKDKIIRIQQNQSIRSNWLKGQFRWAESGHGDGCTQQPGSKIFRKALSEEFTSVIEHKKTVSLVTQLCYQMGLNKNAIAVLILFFSKAITVPILV